jgi:hypothetical protein
MKMNLLLLIAASSITSSAMGMNLGAMFSQMLDEDLEDQEIAELQARQGGKLYPGQLPALWNRREAEAKSRGEKTLLSQLNDGIERAAHAFDDVKEIEEIKTSPVPAETNNPEEIAKEKTE